MKGAALLVGNHSGGIPYDGAMLLHGIRREHPRHRHVRPLIANFAFRSGWMANVVARVGCVRASMETALPMLARGELVAVFPEGLTRRRQAVSRALSAGALRPRRLRPPRARGPGSAAAGRRRRRRGDSPGHGQITCFAEPCGDPIYTHNSYVSWLGMLGLLPVPTKWTIQIGLPIAPPQPGDEGGTSRVAEEVRSAIDGMIAHLWRNEDRFSSAEILAAALRYIHAPLGIIQL